MKDNREASGDNPQKPIAATAPTSEDFNFFNDERLFRLMIEGAGEYGIFAIGADGRVVSWNAGAERIFGYGEGEIIGRHFSVLFTDEERAEGVPEREMETARATGSAADDRYLQRSDGSRFWATGKLMSLKDDNGNEKGFVKIVRDQTERKQAREELSVFETRFREMFRQSPLSTYVLDADGRVKYVNPAFEKLWGVGLEELSAYNLREDAQADALGVKSHIERLYAGETVELPPIFYDPKKTASVGEGNARWIKTFAYPVKGENGQIIEVVLTHEDISEKIRAEEELRLSEKRLALALQAGKAGTFEWRIKEDVNIWSPELEAIYGVAPGTFAGNFDAWYSRVVKEDGDRVVAGINEAIEKKRDEYDYEFRAVLPDGNHRWLAGRARFYYDEENQPEQMVGVNFDITGRKRHEAHLAFLAEFSQEIISLSNISEIVRRFGEKVSRLFEASVCTFVEINETEAVINYEWRSAGGHSLIGTYDLPQFVTDEFREAMSAGQAVVVCDTARDTRIADKEKLADLKIGSLINVPLIRGGEWKFMLGVNREQPYDWQPDEIALMLEAADRIWSKMERVRAEEAVRESHARRQFVLESSKIGEWELDLTTGKTQRTIIHDQCFGAAVEPFAEWSHGIFFSYVHPDDRAEVERKFGEAIRDQKEWNFECRVVWADESVHWIQAKGNFYLDEGGEKPTRLAGIVLDVTERKQAEAEREQMLEREQHLRHTAEQANRAKDEFLAVVSHELRTPLNAILGWSQMMRSGVVKSDQFEKSIETIERNARSQAQLIDDLLDITRIITGKLRLNLANVNLASVVNSAVQTVQPAAQAKNIHLSINVSFDQTEILGDAERLQQIVWNLLSNAVKFTPKNGKISVKLELKGSHLKMIVRDTGEGIEPEFLPFVFDRFSQAGMTTTRRMGGLGLGLSIVRHLVEMHGGTISVSSEGKGHGTAFTVNFPFISTQSENQPALPRENHYAESASAPTARLDDIRILVVDDEPDACELLKVLLEQCGARVSVANSVVEAMQTISAETPDVIVSDIAMPDEDGYELIKRVRSLPKNEGGVVPAIALTAYASPTDRKKALAAGFQSHLTKPIDQNALITILASLV